MKFLLLLIALLSAPVLANITDGQLEIRQIADNVYLHTSYGKLPKYGYYPSNGLVVVDGKDAYIVDTPWPEKDTAVLVQWIEDNGWQLKAALPTHFHSDRTAGLAHLNEHGVETHASTRTNQLLQAKGRAQAVQSFSSDEYSLAGGKIQAFYPGKAHSHDNIVIWLPESKILFGGCLIRSQSTTTLGNTADGSVADWPETVQKVMKRFPDAEQVVPGHGDIGGNELLSHTKNLASGQ